MATIAHVGDAAAAVRSWLAENHRDLVGKDLEVVADGDDGHYWFQVYDGDENGNKVGEEHGTGYVKPDGAIEGLY